MKLHNLDLIFCALIIASLAIGAYERNQVYRSDESLWRDVVEKSPNKARPHNNLGVDLMRQSRFDEAKKHIEKAIELEKDPHGIIGEAYNNMGIVLGEQKKFEESFTYFNRALKIDPKGLEDPGNKEIPKFCSQVENNIGIYKFRAGDTEEALVHLRKALKWDSTFELARQNFQRIAEQRIRTKDLGLRTE